MCNSYCIFTDMDAYNVMKLSLAVVFSLFTFASCRSVPYGLNALSSGGNAMPLPLKGKDLKRDWCIGRSMAQQVHHAGCNSTEVKTKLCFGQCMTFFVQMSRHSSFSSCSQCTPSKIELIEVKLKCFNGTTKKKRVPVVKRCSCRSCSYAQFYLRTLMQKDV